MGLLFSEGAHLIQIDLSRPDVRIDKIRWNTPQIILGSGPEPTWTPSIVRIDRNPTRKWGLSDVTASKPIRLYAAGEYQVRSYLDSKRGTAFAVDFLLTKDSETWNNLSLEILRVNFQTTFIVFGVSILVLPTSTVRWVFSNLSSNKPLFNGGQNDQPTRFDRINALLDED
jgi:hypothetical protein